MTTLSEIKRIVTECKPELQAKYGISTIGIFGSYVRGEETHLSDVDILVEFNRIVDLFDFVDIEEFLTRKIGIQVDLVMKDSLKTRIKNGVLEQVIML